MRWIRKKWREFLCRYFQGGHLFTPIKIMPPQINELRRLRLGCKHCIQCGRSLYLGVESPDPECDGQAMSVICAVLGRAK